MDGFRTRIERARTQLQASSPNFALTAPTVALSDAGAKAQIAGRRLLLVGGQAVVLLLAFVLLAATRLRRGARAAARRLESFGATGWQARLAALAEAAVVVLPATLLGWLLGASPGASSREATDTPPGAVVSRSVASWDAIELDASAGGRRGRSSSTSAPGRGRSRSAGASISVADVAAAGALVGGARRVRGRRSRCQSLASSEGTGVVLMLLPGLIALVAAVVIARDPATGAPSLRAGGGPTLALAQARAALARESSGTATVAVVFVSVSVGLAVFAAAYRSTLIRGDEDRAAFEIPLDYTVKRIRGSLRPRRSAPSTRNGSAPFRSSGFRARPRRSTAAPSPCSGSPRDDLERLHWRSDFASDSPSELADRIGGAAGQPPGHADPGGRARASAPGHDPRRLDPPLGERPHPDGRFVVLDLGEPRERRPAGRGPAPMPPAGRGGLLVGLLVEFSRSEAFTAAHRETGGPHRSRSFAAEC